MSFVCVQTYIGRPSSISSVFGSAGAHGDVADEFAEFLQRDWLSILVTRNLEARALSFAPDSRRISKSLARVESRGLSLVLGLAALRRLSLAALRMLSLAA